MGMQVVVSSLKNSALYSWLLEKTRHLVKSNWDALTNTARPLEAMQSQNDTFSFFSKKNSSSKFHRKLIYTQDQVNAANYVLFVFYPILLICCTVGNSLNLAILGHQKKRESTSIYLIVVAISDLFVL
jgi:hypothetical protein